MTTFKENKFQIYELAKDDHVWRVDWFGAVTYVERYRRSSQPLIEIQFSQVTDNFIEASVENIDPTQKTKTLRLPIGFLPMFKAGDVWHQGRLVERPEYNLQCFQLSVGRHSSSLIKAGSPDPESGKYYLSMAHHPHHMRHTQSYCVHVKTEFCHVIIPSMELIRFYFGSSSTLISRIFDTPFTPENFWERIEDEHSRSPKIHLAPGFSGRSASDIGRIAFSRAARIAAELVGRSCIAANARGDHIYPKGVFPFEGETNLAVSGQWLPFNDNDQGVFLVFKIISCTHPFPFSSLRYTAERSARSNEKMESANANESQKKGETASISRGSRDEKKVVDDEPDKTNKPKTVKLFSNNLQFPDLAKKFISKIENNQVPTLRMTKDGMVIDKTYSVGDAGRNPSIKPVEFSGTGGIDGTLGSTGLADMPAVQVFFQLVKLFHDSNRYASVDIIRLDPRQRIDHLSVMPNIIDVNGDVVPDCICELEKRESESDAIKRSRQISIAKASGPFSSTYLMVPEVSPTSGISESNIELHLLIDRAENIKSNSDLLIAIAKHFLLRNEFRRVIEHGLGTFSIGLCGKFACRDGDLKNITNFLFLESNAWVKQISRLNFDERPMVV